LALVLQGTYLVLVFFDTGRDDAVHLGLGRFNVRTHAAGAVQHEDKVQV